MDIWELTHVVVCIKDHVTSLCGDIVHGTLELGEISLVEGAPEAGFEGAHSLLQRSEFIHNYLWRKFLTSKNGMRIVLTPALRKKSIAVSLMN